MSVRIVSDCNLTFILILNIQGKNITTVYFIELWKDWPFRYGTGLSFLGSYANDEISDAFRNKKGCFLFSQLKKLNMAEF